jgi:transcriptional regulator with XRE-family HTH domain
MTENEYYAWLGKRLRELREKAGLKQKELAEKVELSAQFISNVENRGQKISAYQLTRIIEVMGFSQADLLDSPENLRSWRDNVQVS